MQKNEEEKSFEELWEKWKARDFSWSQISAFEYDPEQWFRCYFKGKKDPHSPEMLFGSKVGKLIEKDPDYLPEIPRIGVMEFEFRATHVRTIDTGKKDKKGNPVYEYEDIRLVGYADSFCIENLVLHEYKTGVKAWDRKRVALHGQITMYLYMLYLNFDIDPSLVSCNLHWMPTTKKEKYEKGTGDLKVTIDFVEPFALLSFPTKRTLTEVLKFGGRINDNISAMEKFAKMKYGITE